MAHLLCGLAALNVVTSLSCATLDLTCLCDAESLLSATMCLYLGHNFSPLWWGFNYFFFSGAKNISI